MKNLVSSTFVLISRPLFRYANAGMPGTCGMRVACALGAGSASCKPAHNIPGSTLATETRKEIEGATRQTSFSPPQLNGNACYAVQGPSGVFMVLDQRLRSWEGTSRNLLLKLCILIGSLNKGFVPNSGNLVRYQIVMRSEEKRKPGCSKENSKLTGKLPFV